MPGRGSYPPAGRWIHDRAERIMASSPETPKSVAYATATQQAHKVGKSPKSFRTAQGMRTAKAKFSLPKKEYRKTAGVHPFELTLRGMLIKEAIGKTKRQEHAQMRAKLKRPPKGSYESPTSYVRRLWTERGGKDPGEPPKQYGSAREKAQAAGIKQPYTARQRATGVAPPPKSKRKPKAEQKPSRPSLQQQQAPKPPPAPAPKVQSVGAKKVTQQVSKLRRYGVPIGLGLAGAAAVGGAAYLVHRRKKRHQAEIDKYWGGKKTAMLAGFMDEMAKIGQAPRGGSLQQRAQLGTPGAFGDVGGGAAAGGGEAPPLTPAAPTAPPAPGGGGAGGMSLDMPTADPFGGKGPPGGGSPMGGGMGGSLGGGLGGGGDSMGGMGGGDPVGGAGLGSKNAPPAPPPPKPSSSSLLNPLRRGSGGEGLAGE